jgi:hypothetical protein
MVGSRAGKTMAVSASSSTNNKKVEYKYLPRDLDTYLREQDPPSKVYGSMFTSEDIIR